VVSRDCAAFGFSLLTPTHRNGVFLGDMSSLSGSDSSDSDDSGSDYDGGSATAAASSEVGDDETDDDPTCGGTVWTSADGRLLLQNDEDEVLSLFKAVVCSKKVIFVSCYCCRHCHAIATAPATAGPPPPPPNDRVCRLCTSLVKATLSADFSRPACFVAPP